MVKVALCPQAIKHGLLNNPWFQDHSYGPGAFPSKNKRLPEDM
jgi:hypothetical protein